MEETRIHLGCGKYILKGWVNVDLVPGPGVDLAMDLTMGKWPWEDNSVDQISSAHLLEHLQRYDPALNRISRILLDLLRKNGEISKDTEFLEKMADRPQDGLIHVMNEAYRVIKPGGKFILQVPTVGANGAFADPTHCRYFTWDFLHYFGRPSKYVPGTEQNKIFLRDCKEQKKDPPSWDFNWYGADYGITCKWDILSYQVDVDPNRRFLDAVLSKGE